MQNIHRSAHNRHHRHAASRRPRRHIERLWHALIGNGLPRTAYTLALQQSTTHTNASHFKFRHRICILLNASASHFFVTFSRITFFHGVCMSHHQELSGAIRRPDGGHTRAGIAASCYAYITSYESFFLRLSVYCFRFRGRFAFAFPNSSSQMPGGTRANRTISFDTSMIPIDFRDTPHKNGECRQA